MRATQPSPAIAVEGLTKRYGDLRAVDDLSFTVRAGAVKGFLGSNGAGKTTALKAILGLARPTAGRALINGAPIDSIAPDGRRLGVYIDSYGAHPGRSARDHLRSLAALAGLAPGRVDEALAVVGLDEAAGRRVGTYSTGMRQRLGLAAAFARRSGDPGAGRAGERAGPAGHPLAAPPAARARGERPDRAAVELRADRGRADGR
jgi:ABC-2 type transport system ATP-binding protein